MSLFKNGSVLKKNGVQIDLVELYDSSRDRASIIASLRIFLDLTHKEAVDIWQDFVVAENKKRLAILPTKRG